MGWAMGIGEWIAAKWTHLTNLLFENSRQNK
jgi:hypothetical protein